METNAAGNLETENIQGSLPEKHGHYSNAYATAVCRHRRGIKFIRAAIYTFWINLFVFFFVFLPLASLSKIQVFPIGAFSVALFYITGFMSSWRPAFLLKNVEAIVRLNDVRGIGELLDAMELPINLGTLAASRFDPDAKRIRQIKTGIVTLLREIRSEDVNILSYKQREILYWYLTSSDKDLICAILQALKHIGDNEALSYVRKLELGKWSAAKDKKVRDAAKECRLILEQRAQQAADPHNLLRASSATSSGDEMLRPAYQTSLSPEETDRLLRPTSTVDSSLP